MVGPPGLEPGTKELLAFLFTEGGGDQTHQRLKPGAILDEGNELPIVDTYRTLCMAPPLDVRAVFRAVRNFDGSV